MAFPAYMTISAKKQGDLSQGASAADSIGTLWQKDHENEIMIQAFDHEVMIPTDPQSGQPAGTRRHEKMTVVKCFDKSSPLLYNALVSGEQMEKVEIKWFRTAQDGSEEHYFTMTLIDAIIVDIRAHVPHCKDQVTAHIGHEEHVAFSYRSIQWRHEVAGTSGDDEWGSMPA